MAFATPITNENIWISQISFSLDMVFFTLFQLHKQPTDFNCYVRSRCSSFYNLLLVFVMPNCGAIIDALPQSLSHYFRAINCQWEPLLFKCENSTVYLVMGFVLL